MNDTSKVVHDNSTQGVQQDGNRETSMEEHEQCPDKKDNMEDIALTDSKSDIDNNNHHVW